MPIHIVDKPVFKAMTKTLDPRFQCPGRNHFSQIAIPNMYKQAKTELIDELKGVKHVAVTADGWTSVARDQYVSLTTHCCLDWKMKSACLAILYAPESHTGDYLAQFLRDGLKEFDIFTERVSAITTDSAKNMVSMGKKLQLPRVPCFGHVLHNAINSALSPEPIENLLRSVRKLVSVFSFSNNLRQALAKAQKELHLKDNMLVNDVSTRWGSKLKMMERLKEQYPAVEKIFKNGVCKLIISLT